MTSLYRHMLHSALKSGLDRNFSMSLIYFTICFQLIDFCFVARQLNLCVGLANPRYLPYVDDWPLGLLFSTLQPNIVLVHLLTIARPPRFYTTSLYVCKKKCMYNTEVPMYAGVIFHTRGFCVWRLKDVRL